MFSVRHEQHLTPPSSPPQFGHLFASGATREDARKALVLSLKELLVRGEIRTAVEYLVQLLGTEAFMDNTIDTSWLDKIIAAKQMSSGTEPQLVVGSAALYRACLQVPP